MSDFSQMMLGPDPVAALVSRFVKENIDDNTTPEPDAEMVRRKEIAQQRFDAGQEVSADELLLLTGRQQTLSRLDNAPREIGSGAAKPVAAVPRVLAQTRAYGELGSQRAAETLRQSPEWPGLKEDLKRRGFYGSYLTDFSDRPADRQIEQPDKPGYDQLGKPITSPDKAVLTADLYAYGDRIEKGVEEFVGRPDPALSGEYLSQLENAVGQMAPMAISALVVGPASAVGLGGAQMADAQFQDARRYEADLETALEAGTRAFPMGFTEALPILRMLNRVGAGSVGLNILKSAGEEAFQEYIQTVGENLIARGLYDPDRKMLVNAPSAASVGAGAGAVMATISEGASRVLGARSRGGRGAQEDQAAALKERQDQILANVSEHQDARGPDLVNGSQEKAPQTSDPEEAPQSEGPIGVGDRSVSSEETPAPQEEGVDPEVVADYPESDIEDPDPATVVDRPGLDEEAIPIKGAEIDPETGLPTDPTQVVFVNQKTGDVRPYGRYSASLVDAESRSSIDQGDDGVTERVLSGDIGGSEIGQMSDRDAIDLARRIAPGQEVESAEGARRLLDRVAEEDLGGGLSLAELNPDLAQRRDAAVSSAAAAQTDYDARDPGVAVDRLLRQPKSSVRRIAREFLGRSIRRGEDPAQAVREELESRSIGAGESGASDASLRLNGLIDEDISANPRSNSSRVMARGRARQTADLAAIEEAVRQGDVSGVTSALSAAEAKEIAKRLYGETFKTKREAIARLRSLDAPSGRDRDGLRTLSPEARDAGVRSGLTGSDPAGDDPTARESAERSRPQPVGAGQEASAKTEEASPRAVGGVSPSSDKVPAHIVDFLRGVHRNLKVRFNISVEYQSIIGKPETDRDVLAEARITDGKAEIVISDLLIGSSPRVQIESVAHEYGHLLEWTMLEQEIKRWNAAERAKAAAAEVSGRIYRPRRHPLIIEHDRHMDEVRSRGDYVEKVLPRGMSRFFAGRWAKATGAGLRETVDPAYEAAFSEWWANQVSRVLSTSSTAQDTVSRFFRRISEVWKRIARALRAEGYARERVTAWLENAGLDVRVKPAPGSVAPRGAPVTRIPAQETEFTPRRSRAERWDKVQEIAPRKIKANRERVFDAVRRLRAAPTTRAGLSRAMKALQGLSNDDLIAVARDVTTRRVETAAAAHGALADWARRRVRREDGDDVVSGDAPMTEFGDRRPEERAAEFDRVNGYVRRIAEAKSAEDADLGKKILAEIDADKRVKREELIAIAKAASGSNLAKGSSRAQARKRIGDIFTGIARRKAKGEEISRNGVFAAAETSVDYMDPTSAIGRLRKVIETKSGKRRARQIAREYFGPDTKLPRAAAPAVDQVEMDVRERGERGAYELNRAIDEFLELASDGPVTEFGRKTPRQRAAEYRKWKENRGISNPSADLTPAQRDEAEKWVSLLRLAEQSLGSAEESVRKKLGSVYGRMKEAGVKGPVLVEIANQWVRPAKRGAKAARQAIETKIQMRSSAAAQIDQVDKALKKGYASAESGVDYDDPASAMRRLKALFDQSKAKARRAAREHVGHDSKLPRKAAAAMKVVEGDLRERGAPAAFDLNRVLDELLGEAETDVDLSQNRRAYAYPGPNAKGANLGEMERAIALENEGESADEIERKTGWFRSPLGWRYRLDPNDLEIVDPDRLRAALRGEEKIQREPLLDLIRHPLLEEAYGPFLDTIRLTVKPSKMDLEPEGLYGITSEVELSLRGVIRGLLGLETNPEIQISAQSIEGFETTLQHELQHVIQIAEAVPVTLGSPPRNFDEYWLQEVEEEARMAQRDALRARLGRVLSPPSRRRTLPKVGNLEGSEVDSYRSAFLRELEEGLNELKRSRSAQASAPAYRPMGDGSSRPDPKIHKDLTERAYQTLIGAPRKNGRVSRGELLSPLDVIRSLYQDSFIAPLRMMQEAQRRRSRQLEDDENVYLLEKLYSGRVGDKMSEVDFGLARPTIDDLGEAEMTLEQLDEYLMARHAPERNAQIARINPKMPDVGSGMTTAKARAVIAKYESGDRNSKRNRSLRRIVRRMRAMRRKALLWRVESGLMTQSQAIAWRRLYRDYVPLKGWDDISSAPIDESVKIESGASTAIGAGNSITVGGGESRRALGRGDGNQAASPFVQFMVDIEEGIIRGEKNRILQAMAQMARKGDMSDFVEEVKVVNIRVYNHSTGQVETVARNPMTAPQEANHVAFKEDGKERRLRFKDADVAAALKRSNAPRMEGAMRLMQAYMGFFSASVTSWNPAFVLVNMARDIGAFTFTVKRFKSVRRRDVLRHYGSAMSAAYRGLNGDYSGEYGKWFKRFQRAGGKISFFDMGAIESKANTYRRRAKASQGTMRLGDYETFGAIPVLSDANVSGIYRFANGFADAVERVNLAVDNALRLSVFRSAVENGVSDAEAAAMARDVTVDFNKKGFRTSAVNAIYPFFNAAIQGTETLMRAVYQSTNVRAGLGMLVAMGFFQELAHAFLGGAPDDDELSYDRIPNHVLEHNAVIVIGDLQFTIPLQYGINIPYNLGRVLARRMRADMGDDVDFTLADAMGSLSRTSIEAFVPMYEGDDKSPLGVNWLKSVSPQIVDPLVDIYQNRTFTGAQIMPDNPFDHRPNSQKYFENVSQGSKWLSGGLNRMTGGSSFESGLLDLSPEYFDHLVTQITGGAGAFVSRSVDLAGKAASGKLDLIESHDIPISRRFVRGTSGTFLDRSVAFDRITEALSAATSVQLALGKAYESGSWKGPVVDINDEMLTKSGRFTSGAMRAWAAQATPAQIKAVGLTPKAVEMIADGAEYKQHRRLYNELGGRLARLYKSGKLRRLLMPVEMNQGGGAPRKVAKAWLESAGPEDARDMGLSPKTLNVARLGFGVDKLREAIADIRRRRKSAEDLPTAAERQSRLQKIEEEEKALLARFNRRFIRAIVKGESEIEDPVKSASR